MFLAKKDLESGLLNGPTLVIVPSVGALPQNVTDNKATLKNKVDVGGRKLTWDLSANPQNFIIDEGKAVNHQILWKNYFAWQHDTKTIW